MINHKQREIIDDFYKKAKDKFPEIEFKELTKNPDDPEHIWIIVTSSFDDTREEAFRNFESEIEADIHIDYGYRISIMLENRNVFAG
jgi:hypothetical protein